jgi:hypothetical protein
MKHNNDRHWYVPVITKDTKFNLFSVIKRFLGLREKLTYEERIAWFVQNFYETGMEYPILLENMKHENLDNLKWYDDFIKIPKYTDEL